MASVRRVPAGRTSAALLLTPVSSAIIAAVVLGERLTPVELFGAALILVGIAGAGGVLTSGVLGRRAVAATTRRACRWPASRPSRTRSVPRWVEGDPSRLS